MSTMTAQATQVYEVYIKATPQQIWDAITKPEFTEKYFYGSRAKYDLRPGGIYNGLAGDDSQVLVDGEGLRVRDHGTGIDERDLPHVFDRFFRGANARGQQGSGLGLAIVRQVTSQHGGTATAANAPDGGAVFAMHLPTVPAAEPQSRTPAPAQA